MPSDMDRAFNKVFQLSRLVQAAVLGEGWQTPWALHLSGTTVRRRDDSSLPWPVNVHALQLKQSSSDPAGRCVLVLVPSGFIRSEQSSLECGSLLMRLIVDL